MLVDSALGDKQLPGELVLSGARSDSAMSCRPTRLPNYVIGSSLEENSERDCGKRLSARRLNREDAVDRVRWMKQIRGD